MTHLQQHSLNIVVTYRVCQHWRSTIFERLNAIDGINLTVLHGTDVRHTKLINDSCNRSFRRICHRTIKLDGKDFVFHPFIWMSLVRLRPDVILAEGGSNFLTNFVVLMYARLTKTPVVWWTLGRLRSNRSDTWLRRIYRAIVAWQERMSDVYLGYSSMASEYFREMQYPPSRCFVAVNCVDTERVRQSRQLPVETLCQLRTDLQLTSGKTILFIGALAEAKRVDRLIKAFAEIINRNPDLRLIVVGDGPCRTPLESLCSTLGVSSQVHFVGRVVDGVAAYYSVSDIFVLPGLGGLAVSEAMAHGLPVICSRGDGCEVDFVRDGRTGFRIDSDNDAEVELFLSEKIEYCLNNKDVLASLKAQSESLISNEFNVNTYLDGILAAVKHAASLRA